MSQYVVTYVSEAGQTPLSLTLSLGNDEQARQFASRTAQRCHGVTLETVDDDGAVAAMSRWLDGALTRANGVSPLVIEDEADDDETENEVSDDDLAITEEDAEGDDEAHHFEGQCMKCKTKREFIGRVIELSNGSRQARGHCPVCGTSIVRMVARTTPLDDDWEDDPEVVSEVEAEADAQDETETADLTEAVEEAIAEVAEGEPIAEVAEVAQAVAVEFSNAATEVEQKPAPRKRAPRKTAAEKANGDNRTANQKAAANPTKGHCPKCDTDVDVIERAGIRIFTLHPDEAKGLDRCPGSTTVVQGG